MSKIKNDENVDFKKGLDERMSYKEKMMRYRIRKKVGLAAIDISMSFIAGILPERGADYKGPEKLIGDTMHYLMIRHINNKVPDLLTYLALGY